MPIVIGQRSFALGGTDTFLALYSDELVRQMSIGNNWTELRIGILCSINSPQLLSARLRIGICTYNATLTEGIFAWNTTNWTGYTFPQTSSTGVNYNAGPPPYYDLVSGETGVRTGTTFTGSGQFTSSVFIAQTGVRSIQIIQITKGSPNYTFAGWGVNSAPLVTTDYQFSDLTSVIQDTTHTPPQVGGTPLVGLPGGTAVATGENAGIYDAFSIAWQDPVYPLEIYGIAVYRVS